MKKKNCQFLKLLLSNTNLILTATAIGTYLANYISSRTIDKPSYQSLHKIVEILIHLCSHLQMNISTPCPYSLRAFPSVNSYLERLASCLALNTPSYIFLYRSHARGNGSI